MSFPRDQLAGRADTPQPEGRHRALIVLGPAGALSRWRREVNESESETAADHATLLAVLSGCGISSNSDTLLRSTGTGADPGDADGRGSLDMVSPNEIKERVTQAV